MPSSLERYLFVVRGGETELFRILQERLQEPGLVDVIWDRRIREQRSAPRKVEPDRRRGERRGPPPTTWVTQGFVLVRQPIRVGSPL